MIRLPKSITEFLRSASLRTEISNLRHEIWKLKQDAPVRTALPPFPVPDATEPSVAVAMRDFVRPGDTVFDIGAHVGALSSMLSRLVGPKGRVISFEANPATAAVLCANMVAKAHFNVWIMPEAVSSEPHRWANIEESGAASRIGANGYRVATTSIDYVCQKYDVRPAFLKIDIEGEEINALKGGARLLASEKPTLIFEHGIGDDRAISLLKDCGYALYDVASYKPVASSTDYEPGVQISNILAIHESKIQASPYAKPPTPTTVKTFDESQFIAANPSNSAIKSVSSTLPPGRYVFVLSRATLDKAVDLFCCVKTGKVVLGHLETNGDFFIRNHRSMPFHVESEGEFVFEFGEVARAERASLHVKEVQLWRIDFAEEGAA